MDGPQLKLVNRNGVEVSRHFPELSGLPRQVSSDSAVLDGELVCLDKQGHPDFAMLQLRLQKPEGVRSRANPVHFIACDVLRLDGGSVMGEPLVKRKNLLHQIMKPSEIAQPCEFIENDGKAFFQATCELGLEGVVAKAKESLYFPGKRSQHWLKVKRVRESEFVVGGYTFGGNKSEAFTSLILGLHDNDGQLLCVRQLATGFTKNLGRGAATPTAGIAHIRVPFCCATRHPQVHLLVQAAGRLPGGVWRDHRTGPAGLPRAQGPQDRQVSRGVHRVGCARLARSSGGFRLRLVTGV